MVRTVDGESKKGKKKDCFLCKTVHRKNQSKGGREIQFIQFIFSSFWVWLEFILLVLAAGAVIIVAIKEAKKKNLEELDCEKTYAELLRTKAKSEWNYLYEVSNEMEE